MIVSDILLIKDIYFDRFWEKPAASIIPKACTGTFGQPSLTLISSFSFASQAAFHLSVNAQTAQSRKEHPSSAELFVRLVSGSAAWSANGRLYRPVSSFPWAAVCDQHLILSGERFFERLVSHSAVHGDYSAFMITFSRCPSCPCFSSSRSITAIPSWAARCRVAALQRLVEAMTAFAPFPPKRSRRMASSLRASVLISLTLQLINRGMTPRVAITSISLVTLPCPKTSSHRTTALLMTSPKMFVSKHAFCRHIIPIHCLHHAARHVYSCPGSGRTPIFRE